MKLPRDYSADDLIATLSRCCYQVTRQTGSHVRLTFTSGDPYHITIPRHNHLAPGTLHGVISAVSEQLGISRTALMDRLFA